MTTQPENLALAAENLQSRTTPVVGAAAAVLPVTTAEIAGTPPVRVVGGASAVIARSQTPGTRQPMKRTDSPIDVVYNAGRLGLRGAISNPLRIGLVSGAWLRIETSSSRGPMPVGRRPATRQSHEQQVQSDTAPGRRTMITWLSGDRGPATFHREPVRRPSVKGLSNLRGPFGVLDSNRIDVKREQFRGHLLDRQMLELIRAG